MKLNKGLKGTENNERGINRNKVLLEYCFIDNLMQIV